MPHCGQCGAAILSITLYDSVPLRPELATFQNAIDSNITKCKEIQKNSDGERNDQLIKIEALRNVMPDREFQGSNIESKIAHMTFMDMVIPKKMEFVESLAFRN